MFILRQFSISLEMVKETSIKQKAENGILKQ